MKIVTFNLRNVWNSDGINSFAHRSGIVLEKIEQESPDVVCFQETIPIIIDFLKKHLSDYIILVNSREKNMQGEGLAVAYKKDKYDIISLECFWLSNTPYTAGSRFQEQSYCPRICQIVLFNEKETNTLFWVYNNHLDHISDMARTLGINLVLEHVKRDQDKFKAPFFILGDFNATPESETLKSCLNNDKIDLIDLTSTVEITFHNFGRFEEAKKIDYILTDTQTAKKDYEVDCWKDELNGIYLSDHYPVAVNIDL